jgi:hypothetical protein
MVKKSIITGMRLNEHFERYFPILALQSKSSHALVTTVIPKCLICDIQNLAAHL